MCVTGKTEVYYNSEVVRKWFCVCLSLHANLFSCHFCSASVEPESPKYQRVQGPDSQVLTGK